MKDMKYNNVSQIVTVYGGHDVIKDLESRMWNEVLKLYQISNHDKINFKFILFNLKILKDNLISLSDDQDQLIYSLEQKFN